MKTTNLKIVLKTINRSQKFKYDLGTRAKIRCVQAGRSLTWDSNISTSARSTQYKQSAQRFFTRALDMKQAFF